MAVNMKCPECDGNGYIRWVDAISALFAGLFQRKCPRCKGLKAIEDTELTKAVAKVCLKGESNAKD